MSFSELPRADRHRTDLAILWRGPLDSCNYACAYCPFAKRPARADMLERDAAALRRFVEWVAVHGERSLEIFFTPWGEALVHVWYRQAIVELTRISHVRSVSVQTNGSAGWRWAAALDAQRFSPWISWHPTQIALGSFLERLAPLIAGGFRFSVGAVGIPAHLPALAQLRHALPTSVAMWINAPRPHRPLTDDDIAACTRIDPQFPLTLRAHRSRGLACRTGERVIAVDGAGDIRRCHFVPDTALHTLGNLYRDDLTAILSPRACPQARCDCYLGYAHLEHLGLDGYYGDGLLARIPMLASA